MEKINKYNMTITPTNTAFMIENRVSDENEYPVLDVIKGETKNSLIFLIKNDKGEKILINDWDCYEKPKLNRTKFFENEI